MDICDLSILKQWTDDVLSISYQAGNILKDYWGQLKTIEEKSFSGDLVTEADKQSELIITQALRTLFPNHQIIAEESGILSNDSDFQWFVDPLDGTTNYTHQYPFVAVSIGLTYKKVPILGVVYNPILEEQFWAYQEGGAFLNGKKIQVSMTDSLDRSLLATGFAYDRRVVKENNYAEFCHFTHLTQGVRRCGAASLDLAYVAAGRLDGYWERGLKPWDMVAGLVLVREAGGQYSDYNLHPLEINEGRVLTSNGNIHSMMSHELIHVKSLRSCSRENS